MGVVPHACAGTPARERRDTQRVAGELQEIAGRELHGLRYSSVIDEKAECQAIWHHVAGELYCHAVERIGGPDLDAAIQLLGFDPV